MIIGGVKQPVPTLSVRDARPIKPMPLPVPQQKVEPLAKVVQTEKEIADYARKLQEEHDAGLAATHAAEQAQEIVNFRIEIPHHPNRKTWLITTLVLHLVLGLWLIYAEIEHIHVSAYLTCISFLSYCLYRCTCGKEVYRYLEEVAHDGLDRRADGIL
jgi:hypothetical protein